MNPKNWLLLVLLTVVSQTVTAQDAENEQTTNNQGRLSGNLSMNGNFFIRDSAIGAANTPQYDRQLFGADSWLNLNYQNWGFDMGIRFDMFNNSNLLNPTSSYTDLGIGRWYISKKINKLGITGGYIYDIIGSGIIFRAYEERPLAIDQALYGIRLTYGINENWTAKAFTGRQKQQFGTYASVLRGAAIDGYIGSDSSSISLAPGFGVVARTLDDGSMNNLVATLNTYAKTDIFTPKYNTYALSFYNTLSSGPFSWYMEGAYKSADSFVDPFQERVTVSGDTVVGRYVNGEGSVFYSSLSFAKSGLGLTVEGKRTENFDFRTNPQEAAARGLLHYIPPMARVNTYRLLARYAAATQFVGEQAFQVDARYAVNRKLSLSANFSNITNLDGDQLYREIFTEIYYKYKRKWTLTTGIQLQEYNQEVYYGKPDAPLLKTVTPYADFLYKFNTKTSIRLESQYMNMNKDHGIRSDYGNWFFALAEFTLAPHWAITVSDMYNIDPGKLSPTDANTGKQDKIHYPRFDVYYTYHANRFSLSYVKQVEGIVCSGGICRLEPAFSGVKMSVNSTF
ncbi:MAG: DUF6029 family protein [Saprospiraceae bacterium]|nr:DUF6029 family protein [Saprospiraceae bacterium]MCF8250064.1 DUF6029 family protein [Saprospiraceae bacterium]MCF8279526.1 DUF6029 family protein [Bacteroidales bacterium]MCF8311970.1 DUF6029 family protein [Saprospiraceae bacterium]MCF8440340.1 DUF6029 family protein [Saprospiraceae bacterium]